MSDDRIYDYVMFLRSVAIMVSPDPMLIPPIRDPNDVVVLQTAMIGGAELIRTTDQGFFEPPAWPFLQALGIQVFTDAELMARLRF